MALADSKGNKLNEYVNDYCLFDLETTGFSMEYDEVVEISAVKVVGGKVVEEFSTLVNPNRPIPYGASSVNGIYDDMVKDAPVFEKALSDFLAFAGDMTLAGHNIHSFDMKFLNRDAQRYWGKVIGNDYVDTLQIARMYLPQLSSRSLTDLADYYGISSEGAHRALNDCRMNQKVYEKLAEEIANPSQEAKNVRKCPRCGSMMKKRNGRFGEFWGCSGYPTCKFTMNG